MSDKRPGRFEEHIAVGAMAVLVVITMLNVVTRYLTGGSYAWTEEISVFLMVVMALAGASAVAGRDSHIRIEFFTRRRLPDGSHQTRQGLMLFAALCSCGVFLLLAALFARWVWDQYRFNETSMGLGIPLWWYGLALPLLCLAISARAFSAFLRIRRGTPPAPIKVAL
ncbi:MAG: TRAP transporter small permease [Ramlibacter sp.]